MQEHQNTAADRAREALKILDQAWAYYTPEARPVSDAPVYEAYEALPEAA